MHCSLTQVISSKKRNLFIILKHLFPKAVISHRSAFEFQSTPGEHIFLTYSYIRNIFLPGVTIHLMEGFEFYQALFAWGRCRRNGAFLT